MAIQKIESLKSAMSIFDDLKEVYQSSVCEDTNALATAADNLKQLPITDDGVTLNMGGVNLSFKKLNTGHVWGSKADKDDPDVSFYVADVGEDTSETFMEKAGKEATSTVDKIEYKAQGYSLALKAVERSLWFRSENKEGWVVLPKVKMYGGLNGTDDNNTAYYACVVTPEMNTDGASLYILRKGTSTPPKADEDEDGQS